MEAIHYHVRNEGRIVKSAVYIAIGIDRDVLGMYVGQNEVRNLAVNFKWLKNRGVQGYPDSLRRWFYWISTDNRSHLPRNRGLIVVSSI